MKRNRLLLAILVLSALGGVFAQQQRLAVLDTVLPEGIDKKVVIPVTEKIMEEFVKSKLFTVVDRSFIEKTLKEQEFQVSDLVANDQKLTEFGGFLKATYIVVSTVQKLDARYFLSAKMIEVQTGVIVAQASADADGSSSVLISLAAETGQKLVMYANGQTPDAVPATSGGRKTTIPPAATVEPAEKPAKAAAATGKKGFGKLGVSAGSAAMSLVVQSDDPWDLFTWEYSEDAAAVPADGGAFSVVATLPLGQGAYLGASYLGHSTEFYGSVTTYENVADAFGLSVGWKGVLGAFQPYAGLRLGYVGVSITEIPDSSVTAMDLSEPYAGGFVGGEAGLDLRLGKSLFLGIGLLVDAGLVSYDVDLMYVASSFFGSIGLAF